MKLKLAAEGIAVVREGSLGAAAEIDAKQLIDQHHYAIASKATILKPHQLNVPAEKAGTSVRCRPANPQTTTKGPVGEGQAVRSRARPPRKPTRAQEASPELARSRSLSHRGGEGRSAGEPGLRREGPAAHHRRARAPRHPAAMVWDYNVTEPGEFGSKSTSYLVTVTTDLAEYGAGAAGAGPGEGNGAGEAKGGEAGLKVLQCRRRYSDFDRLHKALRKLVGVKALPKYPAKALFNRFNDKVIQDRIAFFLALLKVVADSEALQRSEPVLEFVCKVSPRAPLRLGLD